MMLPLFGDRLARTWRCDPEMATFADQHYSRQTPGHREFVGPGRTLILRSERGDILFAWSWPKVRRDGQVGYNCAIFRNMSKRRSSDIILEAEAEATKKWGPNRFYTYVDARKIKSTNPGYCFQCAGWARRGLSQSGMVLLTKEVA